MKIWRKLKKALDKKVIEHLKKQAALDSQSNALRWWPPSAEIYDVNDEREDADEHDYAEIYKAKSRRPIPCLVWDYKKLESQILEMFAPGKFVEVTVQPKHWIYNEEIEQTCTVKFSGITKNELITLGQYKGVIEILAAAFAEYGIREEYIFIYDEYKMFIINEDGQLDSYKPEVRLDQWFSDGE